MGKVRNFFYLSGRIYGSVFCCLRQGNNSWLYMMLVPDTMHLSSNLLHSNFSVVRRNRQEFAPSKIFWGATFVNINMCHRGTDDRLVRTCNCSQAQDICPRTAKNEKSFYITQLFPKNLFCGSRI